MKQKKINCKRIKIIFPDGKILEFDGVRKAVTKIGLSQPIVSKLLKTGKEFEIKQNNQYINKIKHLQGIKIIPR